MKQQPTEWEKISVYHISKKGLISKVYKELTQQQKQSNEITGRGTE